MTSVSSNCSRDHCIHFFNNFEKEMNPFLPPRYGLNIRTSSEKKKEKIEFRIFLVQYSLANKRIILTIRNDSGLWLE